MDTVRIPKVIQFGEDALSQAEYPKNALVVTTVPPELSDKWLGKMGIQDYLLFDKVQPEPSNVVPEPKVELVKMLPESVRFSDTTVVVVVLAGVVTVVTTVVVQLVVVVVVVVVSPSIGLFSLTTGTTVSTQVTVVV